MSYTQDLAAYHTKKIKRYIDAIPEIFGKFISLSDSESVLNYKNKDGRVFYCEPAGILSAQRGKHPNWMWLDDILRDPQTKLDISQIEKISTFFFEEIEQMPKDELHLIGTPQDQEDLFHRLDSAVGYDCRLYDAIVDDVEKKSLWRTIRGSLTQLFWKSRSASATRHSTKNSDAGQCAEKKGFLLTMSLLRSLSANSRTGIMQSLSN